MFLRLNKSLMINNDSCKNAQIRLCVFKFLIRNFILEIEMCDLFKNTL